MTWWPGAPKPFVPFSQLIGKAKPGRRRATKAATPRGAQVMTLQKGLTRREAYRAASKRARADFRGFSYDRRTGRTVLT